MLDNNRKKLLLSALGEKIEIHTSELFTPKTSLMMAKLAYRNFKADRENKLHDRLISLPKIAKT